MLPSVSISMLVVPKVHTPAAGVVSSVEPRVGCLETDVAPWRVSQARFSETRVDGLMVPVTFQVGFGGSLTLLVSSVGPSTLGVVIFLSSLLTLSLLATELVVSHTETSSVVFNVTVSFEVLLSGVRTVALMQPSTQLPVPGATALVIPGTCPPLAEDVVLLAPGVGTTLSHPVPCPSIVRVVPAVHLLATGDAVAEDLMVSSLAAGAAVGMVLGGPALTVRFTLKKNMSLLFPMPQW